MESVS